MTKKSLDFFATGMTIFCLSCLALKGFAQISEPFEKKGELTVNIASSKGSYLLGEAVLIEFEVRNGSSSDVKVRGLDLNSRYLTVYIAADGGASKRYAHSRIAESKGGVLKAVRLLSPRTKLAMDYPNYDGGINSPTIEMDDQHKTIV